MILGQQYQIIKHLGSGGMGDVLLANDLALDRFVAIKVLRRELSTMLEIDARFRREARLLSRLNHPNVVVLYSFGSDSPHLHYIVMEYVQGETLEARLLRSDRLDPAVVCEVMAQIGSAVADAHWKGIIHRDLKPSNVLLTSLAGSSNFVKVVDFGVAKVFGADEKSQPRRDANITVVPGLIGTPAYMSPEQMTSDTVDARSDIYALGIIACELLTGLSPFDKADGIPKLLEARLTRAPKLPSHLRPELGLPPGVDAVIQKALARKPDDRYPSVEQFTQELLHEIQTWTGTSPISTSSVTTTPVIARSLSYDVTIPGYGLHPSKIEQRTVRNATVVHIDMMDDPYTSEIEIEEFLDCLDLIGARLQQVFEHHRGIPIEPVTDRVVIWFTPEASVENDAERALDAALAARSALDALSRDPTIPPSFQLAFRIGVDSGRVVMTQAQSGARVMQGAPFFESRRIAQGASAGEVHISNAVYRKVRGLYETDVKGIAGDHSDRRVLSKKSTIHLKPSEIYGVRISLIGRDHEVDVLRAALQGAIEKKRPHVVAVSGPSGIGKSRIIAEFIRELDDQQSQRYYFEMGRCTPAWQGRPYEPFIQAIRHRARLLEEDPPEQVQFKIEHYIRRYVASDVTFGGAEDKLVRVLLELLGVQDAGSDPSSHRDEVSGEEAQRKAMFDALTLLYQRLASRHPLVFFIEDFEWATGPTKALLAHILTWMGELPALFLVIARTEGGATPDLSSLRDRSLLVPLPVGPLDAEAGEALARHMLRGLIEVPGWLLRQITALAEGVPLIIEETVHDLIDDGVIRVEQERWRLASPSTASLHLPGTLDQLFLARLERLEPHLRAVVDAAAVAGRRFWPSLLKELTENRLEPRMIAELVRRGIFVERRDFFAQREYDYGFAQAAIQEVAYRNIPRPRRRTLHKAAALWLDRWLRQAGGGHEDTIGHHFHEAGELSRALPYKQRAAERAMRMHAIEEAVRLLESCREILVQIPAAELREGARQKQLVKVVANLVHELALAGNLQRAIALADEVLPGSTASDPEMALEMARIAIGKGWALEHLGRYADARASFVAAQAVLGRDGGLLALMALTGEMEAIVHLGQQDDCAERLRRLVAAYEKTPPTQEDERVLSSAFRVLGNHELHLGKYEASEVDYRRAYDLALSANAPVEAVDALNCLAAMQYFRGRLDKAEATWRTALKQAEQWDLIQHRSVMLSNVGELELARGDALQACKTLQHAEALHLHLGSDRGLAETYRALSECHLMLGDLEKAKTHAEQGLDRAERIRSPYMLGTAHRTLARVLHALGKGGPGDAAAKAAVVHHFEASIAAFETAGMAKLVDETKALRDSLLL